MKNASFVKNGISYLVKVHADTALPVLAEICKQSVSLLNVRWWKKVFLGLTVVLDLLVVLDRLSCH